MKLIILLGLVGSIYCVGSYRKINPSTIPDVVLSAAQKTLAAQNLEYTDKNLDMFKTQIVKAEGQVVSGMNYRFTVQLHTADGLEECHFEIYYQSWTRTLQVNPFKDNHNRCTLMKDKRQLGGHLLGGISNIDCNSPEIQAVLPEAVKSVNMMSNSMYHMTPIQLTTCTKQLVAGMKYTFNVDFQQSEKCSNDQEHMSSLLGDCPPSNDAAFTDHFQCTVVDARWEKQRYSTMCNPVHDKPKKPLIGGDGHDLCHPGMFKDFQTKQQKFYSSAEEEEKRYNIFCDNMKLVKKIQDTEKGSAVYGATKFADLTEKEFKRYVGKEWDLNANKDMKKAHIWMKDIPEAYDWRDHNAVTEVKNQGSCGSCWAFSTTGNIEGQWAIKKKQLISLSEQELVDCDKLDQGCEGGLPSNAYKEIERLGGLETESDYKYDGADEKCTFNRTDVRVFINDSISISSNESEMAVWLSENGPISIGINAFAMQFYKGGISHPWKFLCNPKKLDHGVLIVGYGIEGSKPYWIVKNSWGPDWGEKGYYLVYRGDGVCGLNTMCTSAIVK